MTVSAGESGRRTWLVVIDMQRIFSDADSPWATPGFGDLIDPITHLADAFAGRTVVTRFLAPVEPEGAWRAYYADWPFALQPADSPAYQLVPELAEVTATAVTVDATTFGKWTPQMAALIRTGDRMVICGVSTDCCVLSTVLAAADAGVEVVVVADACAGVSDDTHRDALAVMGLYAPLVRVATVSDVLAEETGGPG